MIPAAASTSMSDRSCGSPTSAQGDAAVDELNEFAVSAQANARIRAVERPMSRFRFADSRIGAIECEGVTEAFQAKWVPSVVAFITVHSGRD
jgi:hypothetical protein